MSLFKDILSSNESLFVNHVALDYDYQPKLVPYREMHQKKMAFCIKPLFSKTNGRNLFIYGPPGVGKTVACKHVIGELEEETDEILQFYINCWQINSTYKIYVHLCEQLGHKFIQNKKTDELFKMIKQVLNTKSVVFVFDEADKLEDQDFLYSILEEIYRKTVILITNYKGWVDRIDERVKSRLVPEMLEFKPYSEHETRGILKERVRYAFVSGVWDDGAFAVVVEKTFKANDIRTGMYLLKESGLAAEDESSRMINVSHVKKAIAKLDEFSANNSDELEDETHFILDIVKQNSDNRIGDLYKIYESAGGKRGYKYFQRRIAKLEQGKFISLKKVQGSEGNTTIVTFIGDKVRKLTDF
ncbi:AAA family ATPase [Candidatus Woesearchaeota archaeon]|nr:AAA family ATPase [Candidatus Woesearchaeota archaeon]MBW3021677.1 AAA family ATPase [Candidatus Woesearchaeota archaeon]